MLPMSVIEFPRARVAVIRDLATRLLDSRKPNSEHGPLARELLAGFFEICMRCGLDRVLVELGEASPLDPAAIADHASLFPALVAQLGTLDLDGGGPRNVRPQQLADAVVAALGLTLVDEPDQTIALGDDVRAAVAAAMASVVEVELAVPHLRDTIIAKARARCEEQHLGAFDRLAAQLDERGLRLIKQPKIPLHVVQAVQRVLFDARNAIFDAMARTAIDRAQVIIAATSADAAARIDQPISLRLTPRDVAIQRVCDARVAKVPSAVVASLVESIAELSRIAWRAPERAVRAYAASQTFAVGDVIDHPKFGRGAVKACLMQRIDVEFADGVHTLVHMRT